MEALRYIQKITSDKIIISNVEKFIGENAEIIIIPLGKEEINSDEKPESALGVFQKYTKPELINYEKNAWSEAMKRKHGAG